MAEALREKRRVETVRHIRQAAMRLAAAQGAENVTVEAICLEAGISVRTFFNYLPVREAAFVSDPLPFHPESVARFVAGENSLLDALVALLMTRLPASDDERQSLGLAFRLAAREPKLAAMQVSATLAHEKELAELIARRLDATPADPVPALLAAVALAATRVAVAQWVAEPSRADGASGLAGRLTAALRSVVEKLAPDLSQTTGSGAR